MKTQVFPFGHSFCDETTILHNKILQQATDLFMELSPALELRVHKEETLQKASIMLLNCPSQCPFPGAFVPSVAKSCKWHLHDHHSELCSPQPAGMHSPNICGQSLSLSPDGTVSSMLAFLN